MATQLVSTVHEKSSHEEAEKVRGENEFIAKRHKLDFFTGKTSIVYAVHRILEEGNLIKK